MCVCVFKYIINIHSMQQLSFDSTNINANIIIIVILILMYCLCIQIIHVIIKLYKLHVYMFITFELVYFSIRFFVPRFINFTFTYI